MVARPGGHRQPEYLADHVVSGSVMLPAAGYIEALLAAQDAVYGNTGRVIRDLVMHEPLSLADIAVVEQTPLQDGRNMTMMLAPSKAALAGGEKVHRIFRLRTVSGSARFDRIVCCPSRHPLWP